METIAIKSVKLEQDVARAIEEIIQEQDWDDVYVDYEMDNKGFSLTKIGKTGLSPYQRSDITIYQKKEWNPPELDQIENISRWFPEKKLDVPLVELDIKNKPDITPSLSGYDAGTANRYYGE